MQSYTEIPDTHTLQNSLPELLNNDKTVLSCSSGVTFPTANLQVGMLCFRTDQNKLYQLKDATPTWVALLDITNAAAVASLLGGVAGAIPYQSATGVSGFSAAGTSGQMLASGGAGAPTWVDVIDASKSVAMAIALG